MYTTYRNEWEFVFVDWSIKLVFGILVSLDRQDSVVVIDPIQLCERIKSRAKRGEGVTYQRYLGRSEFR